MDLFQAGQSSQSFTDTLESSSLALRRTRARAMTAWWGMTDIPQHPQTGPRCRMVNRCSLSRLHKDSFTGLQRCSLNSRWFTNFILKQTMNNKESSNRRYLSDWTSRQTRLLCTLTTDIQNCSVMSPVQSAGVCRLPNRKSLAHSSTT